MVIGDGDVPDDYDRACEVDGAKAVLADPTTEWGECGVWETDGPAVLMDSVTAGVELAVEYPHDGALPEQAPVPIPPGRWTVRAVHASPHEGASVGLVHLLIPGRHQARAASTRWSRTRSTSGLVETPGRCAR
ncbi:Imm21 family immunity protein [Streptomyces sp. NPDC002851]